MVSSRSNSLLPEIHFFRDCETYIFFKVLYSRKNTFYTDGWYNIAILLLRPMVVQGEVKCPPDADYDAPASDLVFILQPLVLSEITEQDCQLACRVWCNNLQHKSYLIQTQLNSYYFPHQSYTLISKKNHFFFYLINR